MRYLVLGAGSWGTALAILLASNGKSTTLWSYNPEQLAILAKEKENARYLPGITLPDNLRFESDLERAVRSSDTILCMTPTSSTPSILLQLLTIVEGHHRILWGCKGFERGAANLMHEAAGRIGFPSDQVGVVSGPSFAQEVALLQPTALVVASQNLSMAVDVAKDMSSASLRCYPSADVVGVEVGGAVKNVIAVAAGMADGLGFGANARAAIITRGLAEISRLAEALGGDSKTLNGLAGMGDLLLTATDNQSRNRRFGLALGQGMHVAQAEESIGQVVEGRYAAQGALDRARALKVDMPIVTALAGIMDEQITPEAAIHELMTRPIRTEA